MVLGSDLVGESLWTRIGESMDRVEERLMKVVQVLESSGVPYAVVGGNAVRIWVAQVDKTAVRATNNVDILIRQHDLEIVKQAMHQHGFHYRHTAGLATTRVFADDDIPVTGNKCADGESPNCGGRKCPTNQECKDPSDSGSPSAACTCKPIP